MKTADETLRSSFYKTDTCDEWQELMDSLNNDITPSVISAMEEYRSLNNSWISVNDELPSNDDFVLCSIANGVLVYGCWYSKDTNYWYGHGIARPQEGITHWMPFPNKP